MKILRSAIVVAGAAASVLMSTAPGNTATAAAFSGTAEIGCFGCGEYGPDGNAADFTVAGTIQNEVGTGTGWATFTVTEPTGAACVVSGSAQGEIHIDGTSVTGATIDIDASFTWTRVGATAVVSVPGVGTGAAAFKVTEPVGNPCGGAVSASFAGAIAGA